MFSSVTTLLALIDQAQDASDGPNTHATGRLKASDFSTYEKIAEALLATFPSQESVEMIIKIAGPIPSFFHQLLVRKPYKDIRQDEIEKENQVAELTIRHTPNTHPLIIARQMILLAISFRYIHPSFHYALKGFSESPAAVIQRMANAAIDLTDTNDKIVNTMEGLECLLLACTVQADSGHLRAAWLTIRRAMSTAQSICLHHQKRPPIKSIQPDNDLDPQFL